MKKLQVKNNIAYALAYVIGTIVLVFSLFIMLKTSAMGQEQKKIQEMFRAVDQEEELYIKQVQEALASQGYANCGVTMTKIASSEGEYSYQIQIHHQNLTDKEELEKDAVLMSLLALPNGMETIYMQEDHTSIVNFEYLII